MNEGDSPASTRMSTSIDEVVVLPWVPATATVSRRAAIPASTCARRTTGTPRSVAATTSGLVAGTAVEMATSARSSGRFDAS